MMPQLQKWQSRTLEIYSRNFRLLKPSLPAIILRISYVKTHFVFPSWIIQTRKTKRHAIAWRSLAFLAYERFIMSKKSSLVLVIASLLMRNSIASISPIG